MPIPPLHFQWSGEALFPKHPRRADAHFVIGEEYTMIPWEERSAASHGHFFASVTECWKNLPEETADRFPTAESLRKYALIRTGFRDERSIVCDSDEEARKIGAFIRPMDPYAVITVREGVVTVYTAKSQSMRAMDKETFAASKTAVLDFLASLIGVTAEQLTENAGKAA